MQPQASTSHRPPTTVHRLRDLYIQLAKEIILNAIYQPGPHLTEGREWPPGDRFTMIGRKRLDNLEQLTRMVLEEGIAGDLIETGVWRGGATILMRAILQAYQVTDRRVFVADSFRGIPPINPDKYPADRAHEGMDKLEILTNNSLERVRENFQRMHLLDEQVVFVEGWFKDSLPQLATDRLALLRLDGDLYESTMDAHSRICTRNCRLAVLSLWMTCAWKGASKLSKIIESAPHHRSDNDD